MQTLRLCVHYAVSTTVSHIEKHAYDVVPIPRKTNREYRNYSFAVCHSISTILDRVGSVRILPPPPETRIEKVYGLYATLYVYTYIMLYLWYYVYPTCFDGEKKRWSDRLFGPSVKMCVHSFFIFRCTLKVITWRDKHMYNMHKYVNIYIHMYV